MTWEWDSAYCSAVWAVGKVDGAVKVLGWAQWWATDAAPVFCRGEYAMHMYCADVGFFGGGEGGGEVLDGNGNIEAGLCFFCREGDHAVLVCWKLEMDRVEDWG
jgi:hypothetical protein